MGQKVNPISFRLLNGNSRVWASNWFAKKRQEYVRCLVDDLKIQNYLSLNSSEYCVCGASVERSQGGLVKVVLKSGKVSVVVGKNGDKIRELEDDLKKILSSGSKKLSLSVKEAGRVNLSANFIANLIVGKLERRQSFKKAVKSAMEQVMKAGAVGIKVSVAGRLNGAEIARTEKFKDGVIPLHTLRADVDYSCRKAVTTYGIIGVKVWICTKR